MQCSYIYEIYTKKETGVDPQFDSAMQHYFFFVVLILQCQGYFQFSASNKPSLLNSISNRELPLTESNAFVHIFVGLNQYTALSESCINIFTSVSSIKRDLWQSRLAFKVDRIFAELTSSISVRTETVPSRYSAFPATVPSLIFSYNMVTKAR